MNKQVNSIYEKFNSIIRFLYYSLFFITPLVMYSKTSELFEFNKMMVVYSLGSTIVFLWLVRNILSPTKKKISVSLWSLPFLLFLISQLFSTVLSIDISTSLFGYYGRFNGGLVSTVTYILLAFVAVDVFSFSQFKKLFTVSLLASVVVMLWGLSGKLGYDLSCYLFTHTHTLSNSCWTDQFRPAERMFSTLGQPNWLGAYLAIHFFIGLSLLLEKFIQNIKEKKDNQQLLLIVYGAYLVFNFSSVLFTRSRSSLFSVCAGLVFFALLFFAKKFHEHPGVKKLVISLALVIVVPLILFQTGVPRIDRFISLEFLSKQTAPPEPRTQTPPLSSEVTESLDIRKIVWKGAIELGKRYPLFGTGVETFAYAYYFTRPAEHNLTSEWDYLYNKAHNEYLNYFATTGFVGVGTYLIMIGFVLYLFITLIKKINVMTDKSIFFIGLFCSYLTILVTNFFGFSTSTINLFFYLISGFIFGQFLQMKNIFQEEVNMERKKVSVINYLMILCLAMAFLFIQVSLIFYFIADMKFAEADLYFKMDRYEEGANNLLEAIALRHEHVYEDKLSTTLANLALFSSTQKKIANENTFIQLSTVYNDKSLQSSPKNVLYWKTKGKNAYYFYQATLDKKYLQTGIEALNKAQELSPTDPKIPYTLALYHSLLEDEEKNPDKKEVLFQKEIAFVDKAIKLKSNMTDAYLLKEQLLKKKR